MKDIRFSDPALYNKPAPSHPLDVLQDCHTRIRHFVQLSRTLAHAEGEPLREIAEAADAIVHYFSEEIPLHEADENQSLLARLQNAQPHGGLAREAAETMADQHRVIDELSSELVCLCAALSRQPERLDGLAKRLDHVTYALAQIFETHLHLEEVVIFPAIEELLLPAQIAEIAEEMKQRRRPSVTTLHLVR